MNNINDNKIEYRPNADFSGHAYFNFTAEDSSGMTIINNQLNIEVVAEDDPGVISAKNINGNRRFRSCYNYEYGFVR